MVHHGGGETLHRTAEATCEVRGGCGLDLFTGDVTLCACVQACNDFPDNINRSCAWAGAVDLRVTPTNRCQVIGGAGLMLLDQTSNRCDCFGFCESFEANPNRSCWWGADQLR